MAYERESFLAGIAVGRILHGDLPQLKALGDQDQQQEEEPEGGDDG